ncbi:hypothetical protein [Enterobacter hormaechei]|nr:hypothetical protein [Enterobacter hormaechei]
MKMDAYAIVLKQALQSDEVKTYTVHVVDRVATATCDEEEITITLPVFSGEEPLEHYTITTEIQNEVHNNQQQS